MTTDDKIRAEVEAYVADNVPMEYTLTDDVCKNEWVLKIPVIGKEYWIRYEIDAVANECDPIVVFDSDGQPYNTENWLRDMLLEMHNRATAFEGGEDQ